MWLDRRGGHMKRLFTAFIAAIALTLGVALPASAGAQTCAVRWICNVPGEGDVTFVSAPAAAEHGIVRANDRAGTLAFTMFGEVCRVEGP
jgi:hypothetical protein